MTRPDHSIRQLYCPLVASLALLAVACVGEPERADQPSEGFGEDTLSPHTGGESPRAGKKTPRTHLLLKLAPAPAEDLLDQLEAEVPMSDLTLSSELEAALEGHELMFARGLFERDRVSPAGLDEIRARYTARSARAIAGQVAPRLDHIFVFTLGGGVNQALADSLSALDDVAYAELEQNVELSAADEWFGTPDLWGINDVTGGGDAWNYATGAGVVVAVLDTGVDWTHPDLAQNMWQNPGEVGGQPGVDDDGDGFIDEVIGWDFVPVNPVVNGPCDYTTWGNPNLNYDPVLCGDALPDDLHGHGTHVAGTVAAMTDACGVVGVAPDAKLMALKITMDGGFPGYPALYALMFAMDHGADVVNASFETGVSALMDDLVATGHSIGMITVVAAGNSFQTDVCNHSPARAEHAITVSAVTHNHDPSGFSNVGVKVDVAAPGGELPGTIGQPDVDVLSTIPMLDTSTNPPSPLVLTSESYPNIHSQACVMGHGYAALHGTSMAAPHVAGVAALLIEQHPTWNVEEIRQAIRANADDIYAAGFDIETGYGFVNGDAALASQVGPRPSALVTMPLNCESISGTVPIEGIADTDTGVGSYAIEYGVGNDPVSWTTIFGTTIPASALGSWDTTTVTDGGYTIRVVVDDGNGLTSEDRNWVCVDNNGSGGC